ncbi:putative leucine-rich repeat-containing protein DDB_G0290503 [Neodiprion lecontei]|uniref:Leucine-rich repeat-containing protein DDB_G0290503 n=1 Tax=Neodiprion lecontei TaxID=441921 RepID=A0ABM3GFL7_NEOLC|nr:putative leucine-rich repeat-containing protein DDB_G0290503 [Neodiprion lecontei]
MGIFRGLMRRFAGHQKTGGIDYPGKQGREVAPIKPTNSEDASSQSNPGDQTPRSRVSALPTFTGLRRGLGKNGLSSSVPTTKAKPGVSTVLQKRQLENQFATKRQKYTFLRKELSDKQKQALDLYEEVSELRDKVIAAGLKDPGRIEKVQLKNDALRETSSFWDGESGERLLYHCTLTSLVANDFAATFEEKLNDLACLSGDVCREALNKRTDMIGLLAEFRTGNSAKVDPEMAKQLESHEIEEVGELQKRLEEATSRQRDMIGELVKKTLELLANSGEGLVRELREKLSSAVKKLDDEREKVAQIKERKSAVEAQLQKARTKIRELESHANSNEAKIQQLQGSIKSLDNQVKQKEAALEARTKDMHKAIKNSESLVAKTEKQRDSLESRVNELKKKIDQKEAESSETIKRLSKQLEDTEKELTVEKEARSRAEEKIFELTERCTKLEEKSQQLCDLAENTKDFTVKPVNGIHTENELQLWNELQDTRTALAAQEDKLLQIQREKEDIIAVLQQAANQEDPASVKDKLAAELVTKSEELQKANSERTEIQKRLKIALEKSENVERQLSELQGRLHTQSKEAGKSGWAAHTVELHQQLSDLRSTLAEVQRCNEELETKLIRKQLEVEQRDRIMREQSKVLKVRDELIGILKGQGKNGSENGAQEHQNQLDPETINCLVNKQIAAKAEDLQALYTSLESKQKQLTRLEKMVRQMEDENDRSQATRTKLEKEVAQLRLELHERNRDRRYVDPRITRSPNSRSSSPIPVLPRLPGPRPIRSRNPSPRAKSASGGEKLARSNPCGESPSVQKLNDIIRALEIERARGPHRIPRRVSRSLRGSPVRNSTEIREDLYNWLMQPSASDDKRSAQTNSKHEFVKHSRALLNGELSRRNTGYEIGSSIWIEQDTPTRTSPLIRVRQYTA